MQSIINSLAFPHVPCSYDYNLPYLSFINCNYYNLPIRLYKRQYVTNVINVSCQC